ncbi:hypothetical protein SBC1_04350 [Caballeronia sp. SBC1]|nr:hypothetical protein SBC2_04000 [Caballeronia sp. SBC2]QIN60459.1 hypothetical protein SBC1_04350 [Caballeronia sp. SBC1]
MNGSQPGSTLGRQQIASIMPMKSIFLASTGRPNIDGALRRTKLGKRWRFARSNAVPYALLSLQRSTARVRAA